MENKWMEILDQVEDQEQENKTFKVTDLETADWAFRKIAETEEQLQKDKDYAEKQIAKYKNFIENQEKAAHSSIDYFKYLLEQYLLEEQAKDPKFKLKTAVGSASIRKTKSWKYDDEKVIDFLKENNLTEYIRIKEEINKTDLKKNLTISGDFAATPDGEIVEGIKIEEKETITIKTV